jgi:SRSO17 transposase
MPENSTSFVMTNLQGNLKKTLGDLYGLRTWVEYAFRQCKQELGWADYRFTNFQHIDLFALTVPAHKPSHVA